MRPLDFDLTCQNLCLDEENDDGVYCQFVHLLSGKYILLPYYFSITTLSLLLLHYTLLCTPSLPYFSYTILYTRSTYTPRHRSTVVPCP